MGATPLTTTGGITAMRLRTVDFSVAVARSGARGG